MPLFHERHRTLILFSLLGGIHLPCLSRIIPWKPLQNFLKVYAALATATSVLMTIFNIRQTMLISESLVIQTLSLNNVCDNFLNSGRILYFNLVRKRVQAVCDLWDEYFTNDGHDKLRQKLLEKLRKPYYKTTIYGAALICMMAPAWGADQFTHKNYEFNVPLGIPYQHKNPDYLIVASFVFVNYLLYGPMLVSINFLIMEPMTWIAAEFIRLRLSLAEILDSIKIKENGEILKRENGFLQLVANKEELESEFVRVDGQIRKWIIEHQKLLTFHEKMVEVHKSPLTIQLICLTTAMCLVAFLGASNVTTAVDVFTGVLGYTPGYVLFYIMARYGDLVKQHASHVFDSAFASNWCIYPRNIQQKLYLIGMSSKLTLTTNMLTVFPLDSVTYYQLLQTAYSCYSFLLFLNSKEQSPP